jgi:hypothetical protein
MIDILGGPDVRKGITENQFQKNKSCRMIFEYLSYILQQWLVKMDSRYEFKGVGASTKDTWVSIWSRYVDACIL